MTLGIVSSGTLDTTDLIHAFSRELRSKIPSLRGDLRKSARRVVNEADTALEDDKPAYLEELFELLDATSKPYTYFAASEWDGAEFGFRPAWDSLEEDARARDGVIKVNAGDPWPKGLKAAGISFVMEVNDHGNVALKYASNGHTVWDCV